MSSKLLISVFTILLSWVEINNAQIIDVTIPLNNTITYTNRELYGQFFMINSNSTLRMTLGPANKTISFVIIQAHSHLYNITLYNNTRVYGSAITGTNVGLYSSLKISKDTFYVVNENDITLKVYISVHGYRPIDPIPGGANMEFPIRISPFIYAKHDRYFVKVDAQPHTTLSLPDLVFYRMYLSDANFDENIYFHGLQNMMTLEKILKNGVEMPLTIPRMPMRRLLSAYPGRGAVYVVVAYQKIPGVDNIPYSYSVYVPTVSYACSPLVTDDCALIDDITSQLLCAALFFVGLFTCFFGHRFFKTEMFIIGATAGILLTYIVISLCNDLQSQALLGVSFLSGLFFGAIWLLFWWFYGIPIFSVCLATLHFGFLYSAMIYYVIPGGHPLIHEDATFWSLFILIMLLTGVLLVSLTFISNILCCAVLGAYAAVFPIDFYLGSNLKYIIINIVRRAIVKRFNYAIVDPPFQWRDITVTFFLIGLAISGFILQYYHNRLRPPFPPPPRSVAARPRDALLTPRDRRRRYGATDTSDTSYPRISTAAPAFINRGNRVTADDQTPLLGET